MPTRPMNHQEQRVVFAEQRRLYAELSSLYERIRELYRVLRTVNRKQSRYYVWDSTASPEEKQTIQAQRGLSSSSWQH